MDGVYQCNRNRRNLEIPDERTSKKEIEVDFIVRQKEELLWDGTFEGRQWRFEKVRIVPDSEVKAKTRPPHDGEYVGTIEVVVLRCNQPNKQPITGNQTSSSGSSKDKEKSMPKSFDGTSDHPWESKSNSKSKYCAQALGLDRGWDDYGPPPPPLDKLKLGRIERTSENTGTWNPVGQTSKPSKTMEKNKRWTKRSDSREHFRSDFQKQGSPAGSQRGHSGQSRSTTDQENVPPLNLRGGGPGSYSIASSEAMRNWNCGPPAMKEWAQGDAPWKGDGGPPAALDPWTANLPTGDFNGEAETKPQTQRGAWGTVNETRKKPGSKKGRNGSIVSSSPDLVPGAWGESNDQDQSQGNDGNDWGTSGDIGNGDDGGDHAAKRGNNDWNNDSSRDEQNTPGKEDDGTWDPPNGPFNGRKDDWGGNENNDTHQNGDWRAADNNNPKQNDNWGATTDNDVQQDNKWAGEHGQQTDTWGGDDTKQVTTGAKDPEQVKKPTGNQSATGGEKAGSTFSFGNSRATGPKPASKVASQGKPASVKSKAASIKSNRNPFTFDWLKPSLEKASVPSGSPVVVEKASVPGAWALPVASRKQAEVKTMAAQIPPTFSISTIPKPKPYWSTWRNPNTIVVETEQARAPSPEEIEEPLYSIPAEVAQRNMMSHQVRPGRPAAYTHKRNKPKYLDTHESPYAVFLFKYRDKEIIEHMLKMTISEPEVDEKARFASLSKQELIDELIKTKSKLSVVASESSWQATFVKKLDEKLSKLETSKEDVPAIGDWVKTTSPTNGQEGITNSGAWSTNDTQKETGGGSSGNRDKTTNKRGKTGHETSNGNGNGNGENSWGGNANGKSDWNNNNNCNGEASNEAEEGGNDWGTANHNNTSEDEKKDDSGWGWNDNGGGGDWNNNNSADTKAGNDWGNDNHEGNDTKRAGEGGNDHDQGGSNGWDDENDNGGGGGGGGGWDENKNGNGGKKDGNAGFEGSWGANTGGSGGGGGSGW